MFAFSLARLLANHKWSVEPELCSCQGLSQLEEM